MNIGEYSIEKRTITLVLTVVASVAGMMAYQNLGRLEDPEFTIKRALVMTRYPGASASEVDLEVTSLLDRAIQRMGQIKRLESRSYRGLSIIEYAPKDRGARVMAELAEELELRREILEPGEGA